MGRSSLFSFHYGCLFYLQTNTNGEKTLSHHLVAKSVKHFNVILPISDYQIWSMDLLTTQLW